MQKGSSYPDDGQFRSTNGDAAMQRTNIYLDEDQLRVLRHLAADEGQSVTDLVRNAIDIYLAQQIASGAVWSERLSQSTERIRSRTQAAQPENAEASDASPAIHRQSSSGWRMDRVASDRNFTSRSVLMDEIEAVLRAYGGRAKTKMVIDRVGKSLVGQLTPDDWSEDKAGEVIWRKNVRFARQDMVNMGRLKNNSPHGYWELPNI